MLNRFNNAPTDEFSKDVGRKTTIRIVNSQVVAKPHFKFLESKIFSNQIVIVWDPSAYKVIFYFNFEYQNYLDIYMVYLFKEKYEKDFQYILNK